MKPDIWLVRHGPTEWSERAPHEPDRRAVDRSRGPNGDSARTSLLAAHQVCVGAREPGRPGPGSRPSSPVSRAPRWDPPLAVAERCWLAISRASPPSEIRLGVGGMGRLDRLRAPGARRRVAGPPRGARHRGVGPGADAAGVTCCSSGHGSAPHPHGGRFDLTRRAARFNPGGDACRSSATSTSSARP